MWYCAYYMKWIDPTSLCHTDASSDQQCLIACFYLCFCARLRRLRMIVLHLTTDIAPPVYTYINIAPPVYTCINIAPPGYMYINGAPSHVCVSMCANCTATDATATCVHQPRNCTYMYMIGTAIWWSMRTSTAVRQHADICLFSTAQYKCTVADLESE